jgi:hypothetical protein
LSLTNGTFLLTYFFLWHSLPDGTRISIIEEIRLARHQI